MAADTTDTIDAIQVFLGNQRDGYLAVLHSLKRVFTDYSKVREGRVIYRVASRGDYHHGSELKTAQSVFSKLSNRRDRHGQEYSLYDVEDIVGLTVVCLYPKDVDVIAEWIRGQNGGALKIAPFRTGWPESDEKKDESGYRAHHFTLTVTEPTLQQFKCEVQIRTLLHEAWKFKTHGLIYKGRSQTQEHEQQAEFISDVLSVMDRQSEYMKEVLIRRERDEEVRKTAAHLALMSELTSRPAETDLPAERWREIEDLRDRITMEPEIIELGDVSDLVAAANAYVQNHGPDRTICRVMGLLAVTREAGDLDEWVNFNVDRMINTTAGVNKARALLDRSLISFGLGNLDAACDAAERALIEAKSTGSKLVEARSKANLAYYLAELQQEGDRARSLVEDASLQLDDAAVLDTRGYVEIVFGTTEDEIEEGLNDCAKALENAPDKERPLALAFYSMHKRKALQRLLDII